jgi:hypothetical protein
MIGKAVSPVNAKPKTAALVQIELQAVLLVLSTTAQPRSAVALDLTVPVNKAALALLRDNTEAVVADPSGDV